MRHKRWLRAMARGGECVQEAGILHQGQDVGNAGFWAEHWHCSGAALWGKTVARAHMIGDGSYTHNTHTHTHTHTVFSFPSNVALPHATALSSLFWCSSSPSLSTRNVVSLNYSDAALPPSLSLTHTHTHTLARAHTFARFLCCSLSVVNSDTHTLVVSLDYSGVAIVPPSPY